MKLRMDCDKDRFTAEVGNLAPLSWLATAIDTGTLWWLGRNCFSIEVHRLKPMSGDVTQVIIVPFDRTAGPARWAGATQLKNLRATFPDRLTNPWKLDGQVTIVEFHNLNPEIDLAFLAYGFADFVCDLFKRGAHTVRAQWSYSVSQIWGDIGLDRQQFSGFSDPKVCDYEVGDHVGCLPWRVT